MPEVTIAKESKLKTCGAGRFGLNNRIEGAAALSAIFGSIGNFGNQERI
ncbi:MAG: hypothetical protein ACHP79_00715 [Terriglobales bacterium]